MDLLQNIFNANNITGIIALTAVISTLFTALISGIISLISQRMSHKHELKIMYWKKYYSDCIQAFQNLLESTGKLFSDPISDEELPNTLSFLYQSYIYADKQLCAVLDSFYTKLEAWNNDIDNEELLNDCQKYVITVTREINRLITTYTKMNIHKKMTS